MHRRLWKILLFAVLWFPHGGLLRAGGPFGTDNGWAVDNTGTVLLTPAVASQMSAGETGWIRIEMRLFGSHTTWDSQILGYYDSAINNAGNAGLQVVLLIDGGSWPGGQSAWCASNSENNSGANGDNLYVEAYATNAVVPIVQHFRDRVKHYELWNEPNCWSANPSNGVFTGCTYIYPSNYGWLLARSWEAIHVTQGIEEVTLFTGGVLGHNIGGITSYANAGAQYLDDTYSTGTNVHKGSSFNYTKTNYNAYPLDGIGEHIYLNPGSAVVSNTFRQYEDWVHQACTKYEGALTTKKTYLTEFGWQTTNASNANGVSQALQDTNLITAFSAIRATPYVQTAIWFQWKDNPAGSLWYGVVDSSSNPKSSYADYQQFQRFEGRYSDGTTNSAIQGYFYRFGQAAMGNPCDNGNGPWVYPLLNGYAQDFDGGAHKRLRIIASTNGTYELNDVRGVYGYYQTNNGPTRFGFPLSNEFSTGNGTRQNFEFGYLSSATQGISWTQTGPTISIDQHGIVSWTGALILQSATNLPGPFLDVDTASNPFTNTVSQPRQFFRLRN